jgi:hypothetical protein
MVLMVRGERPHRALVPIEAVTAWRPATDALLPTTSSMLFGPMPLLGASVLDTLIR